MKNKGFTIIDLLIVIAIVGILVAVLIPVYLGKDEKKEFMAYCTGKGHSEEDCRWEWKRMKNGQQSVIMPMVIPMGH